MTPREYGSLVKRFRASNRHDLYCAALVASSIYNVNRDPDKRRDPIMPEDIIGHEGQNGSKPVQQSPAHMLAIVEQLNALHGGMDKRPERNIEINV